MVSTIIEKKSEENTAWTSEDREHENVSRDRPAHLDTSYRLILQEVNGAGFSTNLFAPTDSSKLEQSESLLTVLHQRSVSVEWLKLKHR